MSEPALIVDERQAVAEFEHLIREAWRGRDVLIATVTGEHIQLVPGAARIPDEPWVASSPED